MEGFDILFMPFFFIVCYLIFELLNQQQKKDRLYLTITIIIRYLFIPSISYTSTPIFFYSIL